MMTRLQLTLAALLLGVLIGVPLGLHNAYGIAVRDYDDAVYYRAMADSLATTAEKHSEVTRRCLDTQEPVVDRVVETRRFVVALLGRVVRIETPGMTEDR